MTHRLVLRLSLALAGVGTTVAVFAADDAGVHDFLMGRSYSQPTHQAAGPLTVPVSPRRHLGPSHQVARSPEAATARPKQVAKFEWKNDPNWFLKDDTLRKGDLIVLKDRVIAFNGSSGFPFALEDFTTLRQSDIAKQHIGRIAGL